MIKLREVLCISLNLFFEGPLDIAKYTGEVPKLSHYYLHFAGINMGIRCHNTQLSMVK